MRASPHSISSEALRQINTETEYVRARAAIKIGRGSPKTQLKTPSDSMVYCICTRGERLSAGVEQSQGHEANHTTITPPSIAFYRTIAYADPTSTWTKFEAHSPK